MCILTDTEQVWQLEDNICKLALSLNCGCSRNQLICSFLAARVPPTSACWAMLLDKRIWWRIPCMHSIRDSKSLAFFPPSLPSLSFYNFSFLHSFLLYICLSIFIFKLLLPNFLNNVFYLYSLILSSNSVVPPFLTSIPLNPPDRYYVFIPDRQVSQGFWKPSHTVFLHHFSVIFTQGQVQAHWVIFQSSYYTSFLKLLFCSFI